MMSQSADHQLLLGLLALQNGFITRDQLVAAFTTWIADRAQPLDAILVAQKALDEPRRALLEALAAQHLQRHGNDAAQSLAALSSIASARVDLGRLQDSDLAQSLGHVGVSAEDDPFATRAGVVQMQGQRFQIMRPHAAGGLGVVSVAFDREISREVALKEIRPETADNLEARSRFLREAEITGGLEHPGIVPVYGLGTYADGRPFYAMKFIKGDSLQTATERFHARRKAGAASYQGMEFRELLQRFIDVCQAIQYAHDRGVLHRDLKPGNIMLGQYGETLVVDWGLAKPMHEHSSDLKTSVNSLTPRTPLSGSDVAGTQAGTAIGTPQYMSPEQADGRLDQLGPPTDVYALGATLYHVLTCHPPIDGNRVVDVLENVRLGKIVPLQERIPSIPKGLAAVCQKALSLDPEHRYQQTRDLADEIRRWLADEPLVAYREGWSARTARWFRRHRAVALTTSIAVPLIFLSLGIASYLVGIAEQTAAQSQLRETQALALSAHVTSFETALQKPDWDQTHLASLDATVAELQKLSLERAAQARERLARRYADILEERLRRPRFSEADYSQFKEDLTGLMERDAVTARRIEGLLAARLNTWEVVAELPPDLRGWETIFLPAHVEVRQNSLKRLPRAGEDPLAIATNRIPTTIAATNDIRCEVTFQMPTPFKEPMGIEFQTSEKSGYSFLVLVDSASKKRQDEQTAADAGMLVIQRDGVTLRSALVPAAELKNNTITIHALRRGELLQVQVNQLPPIEMLDPFPLPASISAQVVLRWPSESEGLQHLVASQMRKPTAPSPLEQADQLYAQGQFREALQKYEEQARQSGKSEYAFEARYKQAVCLQELSRPAEAQPLLERLSAEGGNRWGTLADFQLWASSLEANRTDLSEAVYFRLSQKYSFEELARIAPQTIRQRILQSGAPRQFHYEDLLNYEPDRIARYQRSYDMDRLLNGNEKIYFESAYRLIHACLLMGQYDRALEIAEENRPFPYDPVFDTSQFRALREMGKAETALAEINQRSGTPPFSGPINESWALYEKAICLHALGRDEEARSILAATISTLRQIAIPDYNQGAVLGETLRAQACLLADAGDHEGSLAIWKELAFHDAQPIDRSRLSIYRHYFTARAMCGDFDDEDAQYLLEMGLARDTTGMAKAVSAMISPPMILRLIKSIFTSPRGKKVARGIALGEFTIREEKISLIALALYHIFSETMTEKVMDQETDDAFWKISTRSIELIAFEGKITRAQLLQLGATWKGNTGFLGWATVQGTLPKEYRGQAACIFGLRFQQLKKPAEARKFFETTLRDAPDSVFSRLATQELAAMDAAGPSK